MEEQLFVRIDKETKAAFMELARQEGKTASEVIRQMVDQYIKERDMSVYLSRLMDRMSERVQGRGYDQGDVERVIDEVRRETHEDSD